MERHFTLVSGKFLRSNFYCGVENASDIRVVRSVERYTHRGAKVFSVPSRLIGCYFRIPTIKRRA